MVASTGLLIPVSWTPALLGYTGTPYLVGATAIGLAFLATAVSASLDMTDQRARRVFFASLLYQPILLCLLLFDTIRL
jgi:heme O synthase-like polyprenyltransferase